MRGTVHCELNLFENKKKPPYWQEMKNLISIIGKGAEPMGAVGALAPTVFLPHPEIIHISVPLFLPRPEVVSILAPTLFSPVRRQWS